MASLQTVPFLREVQIRNFKSIGKCAVKFRAVTLLVGRNGSGKSNFIDALRFVTEGLQSSLDHAIRSRGGIDNVRRKSTGHPRNFAIKVEVSLEEGRVARYGFEIAARPNGGFAVKREELTVWRHDETVLASYSREEKSINHASHSNMPPVLEDRLYLVNAAGLPDFRPVYDALTSVGFYSLNPEAMKEPQSPDAGELLHADGSNIASVVGRLMRQQPATVDRIRIYLSTIVPGISAFESASLGPRETLQFSQKVEGSQHPWRFYAASMSDGTLRALGALVAVGQLGATNSAVRLVAIEEPETALHPAAAGALMDALREASIHTQVVATTHSPDLLSEVDLEHDGVLVVVSRDGNTRIGSVDPASVLAVKKHLYTPGELLRLDQLQPDEKDLSRQDQMNLFASTVDA
ncbi:MAG TPA: AAA family ATPase [Thermoanaerobaculia bacterium]|nr:AAA family ATPase [Thermoanaerobaculia bacterium]